jgi:virulence-associated protein VagC
MNATVRTSAFKSGNSVAVRLPKEFGVKPGDALQIRQNGGWIQIRPDIDPDEQRARLAEMVRRLNELGPVTGGDPMDGRIEFPDRPGLY